MVDFDKVNKGKFIFPYLGGMIRFIPRGSFQDKQTRQTVEYEASVKTVDTKGLPVSLPIHAVRAILNLAQDEKFCQLVDTADLG